MAPAAYYNEIDGYCAEWLRNLIAIGMVAPGDVDTRSIVDVKPDDLTGYTQCHFFAGIGGWSLAARLTGWPDDRPLWTGSCPCQPFSVAGRGKGVEDVRHLWPDFHRLIRGTRPAVVMGEQVAGEAGYAWLDGVLSDLEAEDYTGRAVDIPACSVNAPHIRNRLYWVADTAVSRTSRQQRVSGAPEKTAPRVWSGVSGSGADERMADTNGTRLAGWQSERSHDGEECAAVERSGDAVGGMANGPGGQQWRIRESETRGGRRQLPTGGHGSDGAVGGLGDSDLMLASEGRQQRSGQLRGVGGDTAGNSGFWDSFTLVGPDPTGKYRRVKPGVRLLADGIPSRVAKLRAGGNAINPELAAEVIRAYMGDDASLQSRVLCGDDTSGAQANQDGGQ